MAKQNKNLCPLKATITKQTRWHLYYLAQISGLSVGRLIDKMVRSWVATMNSEEESEKKP